MAFYYVVYLTIPLIYCLTLIFKNYSKKFFLLISYFWLLVVACFRGINVGTDTHVYSSISRNLISFQGTTSDAKHIYNIEYMYLALNRFVNNLFHNYNLIISVTSFIIISIFFYYIGKYSEDYFLSVLIFVGFGYYFLAFNIARQFLAVAIGILALDLFQQDKKTISLLVALFAGLFHNSGYLWAMLILIMILFKLSRNGFLIIVGSLPIISVFIYLVVPKFLAKFDRYQHYAGDNTSGKGLGYFAFIGFVLVFLLIYLYKLDFNTLDRIDNLNLYILLICILLKFLNAFMPYLGRIEYVFEPYLILALPAIVARKFTLRSRPIFYVVFVVFGFILMTQLIPGNVFYGIVPYKTIFQVH